MLNRLVCEKTVDSEDNVVVQYIYTLGAAGERKSVTELDRTVEYSYDSLYRLTSETITEGEKVTVYTYAYDNVSNRILKTENGAETEYVYNALNQLVSDSETSYEYDLNGNLVRVIGSAQSALYEYNSENKLIKATVQNDSLVIEESYTYDYQGNRTSKTTHRSDGVTEYVKYLNDNSRLTNVLAEIDSDGNALALYTVGADLVSQERSGRTSIYLYDGHGSVVGLSNESGVVTDTYCYDAFGNLLKSTGSTDNNYRYCGEQFDETTGLYYLRARYMDTLTGRFISQDSYAGEISDPVSLHKYLYANANPVMYSDPSGYMVDNDSCAYVLDEYLLARLSIEVTSTELMYYSNNPKGISDHLATVIATGLLILGALTCIIGGFAAIMCYYEMKTLEIANGEQDSFEQNRQRKAQKVNNKLTETIKDSRINPYGQTQLSDEEKNRKVYQPAFVNRSFNNSSLMRCGGKMNFFEALAYLGISYGEVLTAKVFETSELYKQVYNKYMSINFVNNGIESGVIADSKLYAEALADAINIVGANVVPEKHGDGRYHYHNDSSTSKEHFIHIWY